MGQNSAAKWAKIWPPNGTKSGPQMGQNLAPKWAKIVKKSQVNFEEVFLIGDLVELIKLTQFSNVSADCRSADCRNTNGNTINIPSKFYVFSFDGIEASEKQTTPNV